MTLRVVVDATPLIGQPTGVGVFTGALIPALMHQPELDVSAFALTVRGFDELRSVLPVGLSHPRLPMPADVLLKTWARSNHPSVERWVGECDVVHGTNFVVPPSKGAMLVTVHDLAALHYPEMCTPISHRYPTLVRKAVERGAHVHTLSHVVANEVSEDLDIHPGRIHVIAPGVPTVSDGPGTSAEDGRLLSGYERYVLALGTIEPRKDYPSLLRAFDAVADKHDDVGMIIAGGMGWGADDFMVRLEQSRYKHRIHVTGYVGDTERSALLRGASVLAYPSVYEGFGLPPLEAMSVGVPVVATEAGSIPEVTGNAAYLIAPGDDEALGRVLEEVLENEQLREEMIEDGYRRVQQLDWETSARSFVALYEELIKERPV